MLVTVVASPLLGRERRRVLVQGGHRVTREAPSGEGTRDSQAREASPAPLPAVTLGVAGEYLQLSRL